MVTYEYTCEIPHEILYHIGAPSPQQCTASLLQLGELINTHIVINIKVHYLGVNLVFACLELFMSLACCFLSSPFQKKNQECNQNVKQCH